MVVVKKGGTRIQKKGRIGPEKPKKKKKFSPPPPRENRTRTTRFSDMRNVHCATLIWVKDQSAHSKLPFVDGMYDQVLSPAGKEDTTVEQNCLACNTQAGRRYSKAVYLCSHHCSRSNRLLKDFSHLDDHTRHTTDTLSSYN